MARGDAWRGLRSLRYQPPAYATGGGRRSMFRASLEQCEQFLAAAEGAGYATRPVHLFYALSQGSRALVAASPRIGNQQWRATGHGLSMVSAATSVSDVTVKAACDGLFQAVAVSLAAEVLATDNPAPWANCGRPFLCLPGRLRCLTPRFIRCSRSCRLRGLRMSRFVRRVWHGFFRGSNRFREVTFHHSRHILIVIRRCGTPAGNSTTMAVFVGTARIWCRACGSTGTASQACAR